MRFMVSALVEFFPYEDVVSQEECLYSIQGIESEQLGPFFIQSVIDGLVKVRLFEKIG